MSNLITILAYDSRPVKSLLKNPTNCKKYPLFYTFKIFVFKKNGKTRVMNAIDIALKEKQFSALSLILDYIIKY
jgi:hypothetical protein